MEKSAPISIETTVNASIEKVWHYWSAPEHIKQWTFASSDWHVTYADNDLRKDGTFKTTMAAKDGSFGFDFEGVYTAVDVHKYIAYSLADGRNVQISFDFNGEQTKVTETFDPETQNPVEMQRAGWQSILDNFKKYAEEN